MKNSELTFQFLTKDLAFTKVTWNGKVIWDDDKEEYIGTKLKDFYKEYGNRFVYSMKLKTRFGHHCELDIKGEEESVPRQLVFGLYFPPNIYEHDWLDPKDFKILKEVKQKSVIKNLKEGLKRFEYTYYREGKFYRVKVKDPKGWLSYSTKFYIFKEDE